MSAASILPSLYIGGTWTTAGAGATREVHNPANGTLLATISYGDADDARQAADAAQAAFATWKHTTARARADLLVRVADLMRARVADIGRTLALETGKRLPEAIGEVRFAAEYFQWFAEQARRPSGEVLPNELPTRRHMTLTQPAGVAVCLTPWNFPISIQARKLAPALAAGCTVVARASEKAPLAVMEMMRCFADAGFPAGVINLIQGPASTTTNALLDHPAVRVVSFTGSTGVGQQIMRRCAERVVRPLLELGGDAPFIVFDDADLDRAVEGAMLAKFRNNGQSCIGANRFFAQAGIYDAFVERFAARVNAMRIGDPVADPVPDLGPVIDGQRKQSVEAMVAEALAAGARRATEPHSLPEGGAYVDPCLLVDVPPTVGMSCQEIFGPVAAIYRFEHEDEVIARANATEMGLAAYFYTNRLDRAWQIAEALEAGIVGLNNALPSVAYAPMGGVKQSGLGREGAAIGLEEFQEIKYLSIEY